MGFPQPGTKGPTYAVGQYYGPSYGASVTAACTNGLLYLTPLWITTAHTFTGIGCSVSVAGTTGAVLHMGVYADNGAGQPGSLIFDAGTVAGTTTGLVATTLSVSLQAGPVWTCVAGQGSPTTQPTLQCVGAATGGPGYYLNGTTAWPQGAVWALSGVTGALPSVIFPGQLSADVIEARIVGLLA